VLAVPSVSRTGPTLFGIDLGSDGRYGMFCSVVFCVLVVGLVTVRRSSFRPANGGTA
jgi:hypothetical protein